MSGSGSLNGGLFTAGSSGAVFELPTRARIRVAPGGVIRVFTVPQLLQLTPGPRTNTWSFVLSSGRADVEMTGAAKSAVLVSLGKLSAVVTQGRVACLASPGEVTVANIEGQVRTMHSDHWQTIKLGEISTLDRENPNAIERPGLSAPQLSNGQRMFFAANGAATLHGFGWSQVPGAARYELRLRGQDGEVLDQQVVSGNQLTSKLKPAEPGKYELAVRALDARGLESGWSAESEVRVIGVVLPPGSYRAGNAIFLGQGQRVQFTDIAGLEMTYQGAGRYFPAASGATLYRNKTTIIGFRLPGSLDTAIARLEPRNVYADVHIGPTTAIWPRDPVSIDIQLKTKDGEPVPAFLQAVPTVTLGLEPLDVTFERSGSVLHAVVPPSAEPGPWVLRVDVADQFGVPLGHDFLEVATAPLKKEPAVRIVRATTSGTSGVVATGTVASSD